MAAFQLRCLGMPSLIGPDGVPIRMRTKKHLALLIYLAVEPRRRHRRDTLADLLWPSGDARHSLSTALSVLRALFGPDAFETTGDTVKLTAADLSTDLGRLLVGDLRGEGGGDRLEVDAFLVGFDVDEAPEFGHWADRMAERHRPAIRDALVKDLERHRRRGDRTGMEEAADRLLRMSDIDEDAVRAKIEGRALVRDRLGALALYERWRRRIADEFGAVPAIEIADLAGRLQRGDYVPVTAGEPHQPPDQSPPLTPLVGRALPFEQLHAAWARVRSGNTTHVLISGAAGIGKSALAANFAAAVHTEGALAAIIHCYSAEQAIPLAMLCRLVGVLCEQRGAGATAPENLVVLAHVCPAVRAHFPSLADGENRGSASRTLLARALADLILAVSDERPLAAVLDDVDRCDCESLSTLEAALLHVLGRPIMTIGCTRSSTRSALLAQENDGEYRIDVVRVEPLQATDTRLLVDRLVCENRARPLPHEVRALTSTAGGNPHALQLLFEDWSRRKGECLALQLDGICESVQTPTGQLGAEIQAIQSGFDRLGSSARLVLHVLATLGREAGDTAFLELSGLGIGDVAQHLTELRQLGVVIETHDLSDCANSLVRAAAYLDAPPALRLSVHRGAAALLRRAEPDSPATTALRAALHFARARETADTCESLIAGALNGVETGDIHAAELALQTGMPLLAACGQRVSATLLLAQCLNLQARWSESLAVLADVGRADTGPERLLAMALQHEALLCSSHPWDPCVTESYLALEQQIQSVAHEETAGLVRLVCSRHLSQTTPAVTEVAIRPARAGTRVDGPKPGLLLDDLLATAVLQYTARQLGPCSSTLRDCIALVQRKAPNHPRLGMIRFGMGCVDISTGHYERAKTNMLEALRISRQIGNSDQEAAATIALARIHARLGRIEDQVAWAECGERLLGGRYTSDSHERWYFLGLGCYRLGRRRDVRRSIEALQDAADCFANTKYGPACSMGAADLLWLVGARRDALQTAMTLLKTADVSTLHRGVLGSFARWISIGIQEGDLPPSAVLHLDEVCAHEARLDALDHVEVLQACGHHRDRIQHDYVDMERRYRRKVLHVPASAMFVTDTIMVRR